MLSRHTLIASFNSLMFVEISLLSKIIPCTNFREFRKKALIAAVVSDPADLKKGPRSKYFPVFSLMIREFDRGEQFA